MEKTVSRILAACALAFSPSFAFSQETIIDVWYGDTQKFGHRGNPQNWANILGNVSDDIKELTYRLNEGDEIQLSIGPDGRRLQNNGDFIIDIAITSLKNGINDIFITATDSGNISTIKKVTLKYSSGNTWPSAYTFNWDTVTNIQNVVQIVDGKWEITESGIRTTETGYDRLVAIGDITWKNYEIEVPVTAHRLAPPLGPNSGNDFGLGVLLVWQGHTDRPVNGWQPKSGYLPLGDIGWFNWPKNNNPTKLSFFNDKSVRFPVSDGVTYIFKLQATTLPDSGDIYKIKVWEDGTSEPVDWALSYLNPEPDLSAGSLMLIAHHVDATFGNPVIRPISPENILNRAPVANLSIPDQEIIINTLYGFTFDEATFTDPDGDQLRYNASLNNGDALPGWLNFNAADRHFYGTPEKLDTLEIKLTAEDDSTAAASVNFHLFVYDTVQAIPNHDPVANNLIPDQEIIINTLYDFTFDEATFTDPDGDQLQYNASLNNGDALPGWLNFDEVDRHFYGTPEKLDTLEIKLTAEDDSAATASVNFHLFVYDTVQAIPNHGPVVNHSIPDQEIIINTLYDFTFDEATFTDPDGDQLQYNASLNNGDALPGWLNFDAADRHFYGTPEKLDTLEIKLTAEDDSAATASVNFHLFVYDTVQATQNHDPVVNHSIPDQEIIINTLYDFTFDEATFTDPDGDQLQYNASLNNGDALPGWLNFDEVDRHFYGTPETLDTLEIKVTAEDNSAATVSSAFYLYVYDLSLSIPNSEPVAIYPIPDQEIIINTLYDFTFDEATFTDPDGDQLQYNASLNNGDALPGWLNFDEVDRHFYGTPEKLDILEIKLTAEDDRTATASVNFNLFVYDTVRAIPNHGPVANNPIPDQEIIINTLYDFTFDEATFTDPDGDQLQYNASLNNGDALPGWLNFDEVDRHFYGTPEKLDTLEIKLTAEDDRTATASVNFHLFVYDTVQAIPNNDPVANNPIPDQEIIINTLYDFTFDEATFTDPDGDRLLFNASLNNGDALPGWLNFDAVDRHFYGTPEKLDTLEIKLTAEDDSTATASVNFHLFVYDTIQQDVISGYDDNAVSHKGGAFNIYPNPVTRNSFFIQILKEGNKISSLELFNEQGKQKLLSINNLSLPASNINNIEIDISNLHLPAGTYLLKIKSESSGFDVVRLIIPI